MVNYVHDNATPENYYKQTNNERDPMNSCFNTSMINVGIGIMSLPLPINDETKWSPKYKQEEDQFDWYMHETKDAEAVEWLNKYKSQKWVQDYLKTGDIRELWDVEVYFFNKWIGKNVCRANYNMRIEDIVNEIEAGRGIVTTGVFNNLKHAVSIVGFKANIIGLSINLKGKTTGIPLSTDEITHFIINDSYGNPLNSYKPVGQGGYDISYPKDEFIRCINKSSVSSSPFYYGIIFDGEV